MLITASKPNPAQTRRLSPARETTLSSGNQVDTGDKLIISGIAAGFSAVPGLGTAVDLGMAWGSHKDGDRLSSVAFLAGGLLNSAGTASFWIGKNIGSATATNAGLAMLAAAPVAGAIGMWNAF